MIIYHAIKPPLGLEPKQYHDMARLREVQGAISRYYNAELEIPVEWIEEYNQLIVSTQEHRIREREATND